MQANPPDIENRRIGMLKTSIPLLLLAMLAVNANAQQQHHHG
jgi:hypothetical protein